MPTQFSIRMLRSNFRTQPVDHGIGPTRVGRGFIAPNGCGGADKAKKNEKGARLEFFEFLKFEPGPFFLAVPTMWRDKSAPYESAFLALAIACLTRAGAVPPM
ncbi:MAG: hypothetical protein HYY77_07575 [Betaproteobacteria bacterium]|nr:hypothetical protein [Betaproteobacteria bacterium]